MVTFIEVVEVRVMAVEVELGNVILEVEVMFVGIVVVDGVD